jgi:bla regulator protein BlaR1
MSGRTLMLSAAVALFAAGALAAPRSDGVAPISSNDPAAESSKSPRPDAFVLFSSGSHGVEMSGSTDDVRRATALRADAEGLLYIRQGGSAYVIRDAATLRRAKSLFEPQEALGRQQAELGSRQAALGGRQARMGAQQAALSYRRADNSPREAEDVARQQEALSQQQSLLGREQAALGRQQAELGRQQNDLSRVAEKQMQMLFGEALRSGLAQRVD